ncbi:sensor histidine kinase [Vibrio fluvialis]|uniref:sensor histidine kinase n=1 Tax=Vibrio fluvialis TaxID=676 RepID=UPI000357009D|nr:ATP-binding protein [Vibrio fluvialis]EPP26805.1 Signal transduction histidine kinase regulating C4-dicarboxylate transport system [Vibrio fluvialis I21563]MBL4249246.1 sensor histidine kinase [Vibrio fluvialis]MBL4256970.1 sensor histidine kinase [Vibrio fluvialis]MBL4288219.1 sensor histidine kinase [Vibrio fluvialis]MBL4292457.1 sensor histidine kinase [Vibrio fluvialis]
MWSIRRLSVLFFIVFVVVTAMSAHLVWRYQYQSLLLDHQSQLDKFSSLITAKLDKYAHIPRLLSKDKELVDALLHPANTAQIEVTNRYLEQVNDVIQAADTYLLDQYGNTLAASNWNLERSFIGRNFAWRPYFYQSIAGADSQYFALGSTSGQRGYYYAYPVVYAAEILGVVVVKMDLSAIEENWQSQSSYFVATDTNQVVFMSSQPSWLFKSVGNLSDTTRDQIRSSLQYLDKPIASLGLTGDFSAQETEWFNHRMGWIKGDFIVSSRQLSMPDLTIRVLSPKMNVFWDVFGFVMILTMVFAIVYLAILLAHHRQVRQRQIEQLQVEAKQKLEFLVMERTAKLHAEIDERIRTEQALRQTQNELIQAAKLAVLGQMSASISHELNNPLAAIRSFADNSRRFLANGKSERTDENLARISALTERMAKISEQLKSFARKSSSDEKADVQLYPIVVYAKELMQPQFKSHYIELNIQTPLEPVWASVNPIQLEQVLINLLTNAMQALDGQESRKVAMTLLSDSDGTLIHVDDNGPGIGQDKMAHLFEPFFTTKQNGLGLGLSISQQIIQSMNGDLTASVSPLGGARFTIHLPPLTAPATEIMQGK